MLDQKQVTINEKDFTIQQLPTTKGLEVTFSIAHILKGLAEGASEEFVFNFTETKVNVGKMIAGVISRTDIKGTPEFIKSVICESVVSPDMASGEFEYEVFFSGEYEMISELFTEIIIHNKFHELVKKNLLLLIDMVQAQE